MRVQQSRGLNKLEATFILATLKLIVVTYSGHQTASSLTYSLPESRLGCYVTDTCRSQMMWLCERRQPAYVESMGIRALFAFVEKVVVPSIL
jgi:hypothetical protein